MRHLDVKDFVKVSVEVTPKLEIRDIVETVHLCEEPGNSRGEIFIGRIKILQVVTRALVDTDALLEIFAIICGPS